MTARLRQRAAEAIGDHTRSVNDVVAAAAAALGIA